QECGPRRARGDARGSARAAVVPRFGPRRGDDATGVAADHGTQPSASGSTGGPRLADRGRSQVRGTLVPEGRGRSAPRGASRAQPEVHSPDPAGSDFALRAGPERLARDRIRIEGIAVRILNARGTPRPVTTSAAYERQVVVSRAFTSFSDSYG